jgi:hypothetical protein
MPEIPITRALENGMRAATSATAVYFVASYQEMA